VVKVWKALDLFFQHPNGCKDISKQNNYKNTNLTVVQAFKARKYQLILRRIQAFGHIIVIQVQWTGEEFTKKVRKEKLNPISVVNMQKLLSSILCDIFTVVGGTK